MKRLATADDNSESKLIENLQHYVDKDLPESMVRRVLKENIKDKSRIETLCVALFSNSRTTASLS
jgi:histone H3/H4